MISWIPSPHHDYRFVVHTVAVEQVMRQGGCEIILADESDIIDVTYQPGVNNLIFSFAVQHNRPPWTDDEIEACAHMKTHRQQFELVTPGNYIQKHHCPLVVIPWANQRPYLLCWVNRGWLDEQAKRLRPVTAKIAVHQGLIVPRWAPHTA